MGDQCWHWDQLSGFQCKWRGSDLQRVLSSSLCVHPGGLSLRHVLNLPSLVALTKLPHTALLLLKANTTVRNAVIHILVKTRLDDNSILSFIVSFTEI